MLLDMFFNFILIIYVCFLLFWKNTLYVKSTSLCVLLFILLIVYNLHTIMIVETYITRLLKFNGVVDPC